MKEEYSLEEYMEILSEQKQIKVTLPRDVFHDVMQAIDDYITKSMLTIITKEDEIIGDQNGEKMSLHELHKNMIFQMAIALDFILKIDHFKELYERSWDFNESLGAVEQYKPFIEEGSEYDYHDRYFAISETIHHLVSLEDRLPHLPKEVKRFCRKLRAMHDEEYWTVKKDGFEKGLKEIYKKKE